MNLIYIAKIANKKTIMNALKRVVGWETKSMQVNREFVRRTGKLMDHPKKTVYPNLYKKRLNIRAAAQRSLDNRTLT